MIEEQGLTDPNIERSEFWEFLHQTFESTKEGLLREAAVRGIDLTDPGLIEESNRHQQEVDRLAQLHAPLLHAAKSYMKFASELLDSSGSPIDPAFTGFDIPVFVEKPPPEWQHDVLNALETISYYHAFIYIKLTRAAHSWAEEQSESREGLEGMPKDSDGSAKVALIGIDCSWNSWATMRNHFEDGEDFILGGLKQLSDLRAATEETFPEARAFVRPGFDTGD